MDLKYLLFAVRDNGFHLMMKKEKISIGFIRSMVWKQGYSKQENMHNIVWGDKFRWGDKCDKWIDEVKNEYPIWIDEVTNVDFTQYEMTWGW